MSDREQRDRRGSSSLLRAAAFAATLAAAAPASGQTIPPSGYPPPPAARAAEQQQIQQQARQAWFRQHRAETWAEAQQEVAQERRNALLDRGRRAVPPTMTVSPPELQFALVGSMGVSAKSFSAKRGELDAGVGGQFELRADSWWALQAGGGVGGFGASLTHPDSSAVWGNAAFLLVPRTDSPYLDATHGYLGLGLQTLFPLGSARVPGAYLGPYMTLGAVNVFGPLQNGYGYAGFTLELRVGYRFALGSARTDPFKGITTGFLVGPVLGF